MVRIDNERYAELLKEKKFLEDNRPHDVDAMRRWKLLQELELFR